MRTNLEERRKEVINENKSFCVKLKLKSFSESDGKIKMGVKESLFCMLYVHVRIAWN